MSETNAKSCKMPCGVCDRGVGSKTYLLIQYRVLVIRSGYTKSVLV